MHIQFSHVKPRRDLAMIECPKCHMNIHVKNAWYHFRHHSTESISCCPICLKKCNNQWHLIRHVQKHPSHFKCNICQYEANNKIQFDRHMTSHNNGCEKREENVKCFIPEIVTRWSNFGAGLRGYSLHDLLICVLCRGICTPDAVNDHLYSRHVVLPAPEVKKSYVCLCGETFFNNILLRHHVFKMNSDDHKARGT